MVYVSKIVTVYGAASETITIEGYYNSSFTTGTDGSCSHVVPIDTITLTGSVSGQSFEKTVTSDTTDVYVMPEGSIYWHGNKLGNEWSFLKSPSNTNASFNINNIEINRTGSTYEPLLTNNKIDISKYSKIVCKSYHVGGTGSGALVGIWSERNGSPIKKIYNENTTIKTVEMDISDVSTKNIHVGLAHAEGNAIGTGYFYAIWFE